MPFYLYSLLIDQFSPGFKKKCFLLCHDRIKLFHVVQGRFDSEQLLEERQRELQVNDVVVVKSQATQNAKQEVLPFLHFNLSVFKRKTNKNMGKLKSNTIHMYSMSAMCMLYLYPWLYTQGQSSNLPTNKSCV